MVIGSTKVLICTILLVYVGSRVSFGHPASTLQGVSVKNSYSIWRVSVHDVQRTARQASSPPPTFPLVKVDSGYTKLSAVSLTVTARTKGTVQYNMQMRCVRADKLASLDGPMLAAMNANEIEKYRRMKKAYSGGIDVPFLQYLGIDLNNNVRKEDMMLSREQMGTRFDKLADAARRIINSVSEELVTVKGTLSAVGVHQEPVTVFAFLQYALIERTDGAELMVLSDLGSESFGASDDGSISGPEKKRARQRMKQMRRMKRMKRMNRRACRRVRRSIRQIFKCNR